MAISHIFFDIDDTLFPSTLFAKRARENAVSALIKLGVKKDKKILYNMLMDIVREKGSNYPGHFDDLCIKLQLTPIAKYIAGAVGAYHETKLSIKPFFSVRTILKNLKKNKYKLYIATNGLAIKQWDKLILMGLHDYFEDVFVSEDLGVEKSSEFFKLVTLKLNVKAKDCLMVGDKEEADILSAKEFGMHTVKLDNYHSSKSKINLKTAADSLIFNMVELPVIIKKL
ncbi:MAG: HAD-IA family hydrolase [Candidatus Micrarchaeota archaeon]